MDVTSSDSGVKQRRLPNPFVLKVIHDWGPSSPMALVKDETQPSAGNLKTLHADFERVLTLKPAAAGISGADILKCKSLDNEGLAPVLRQEVKLTIGTSKLLAKRSRRTL